MSSECRRGVKESERLEAPDICEKCGGCSDGPQWKKFVWIRYEANGVIWFGPYAVEGEISEDDHR